MQPIVRHTSPLVYHPWLDEKECDELFQMRSRLPGSIMQGAGIQRIRRLRYEPEPEVAPPAGSGFKMETAQRALPVTDGNFDFTTTDLGGSTPDFFLYSISLATVNGTYVADGMLAVGFTDGTNHRCLCVNAEDNQGTSDCVFVASSTNLIELAEIAGDETITATITFDSFITNGVRLNIAASSEPSAAYLINGLFFAGSDAVVVTTVVPSATLNASVDVTGLGETANICFTLQTVVDWADAIGNNAAFSFGVYSYDGSTTTQACGLHYETGGRGTPQTNQILWTTRASMRGANTLSGQPAYELSNHASGVTVTTREDASSFDFALAMISLPAGVGSFVGTVLSPTSTGTAPAITSPGFTPQGLVQFATRLVSLNTAVEDTTEAGATWISFSTPDAEYGTGFFSDQSADPTIIKSLTDTKAIRVLQVDPTAGDEHVANIDSWDANGFTPNHTVVDATLQYYSWFLAIEDA